MQRIKSDVPWTHCTCVELLDESCSLFSASSNCFANDHTNSLKAAREYYIGLMLSRGWAARKADAFGYGGMSLVLAFEHGTPNATLPLLWRRRNGLSPLFER